MKNELKGILDRYHGKKASESGYEFYEEIVALFHQLPDDIEGGGSVSPSDFKYAKMQTVHQLLTESVDLRIHTPEDAVKLAQLVDAAYGAIDSQPETVKTSPADDIDREEADFSEALNWLKQGKLVRSERWRSDARLRLVDASGSGDFIFVFKCLTGVEHDHKLSTTDLLATDWVVVS